LLKRRKFTAGRVYFSLQYEYDDPTQPVIISYRYTGKKDSKGKRIFRILGAPPKARMVLEKHGEAGMLDLSSLVPALRRELKRRA
jgi:hypothetical protein